MEAIVKVPDGFIAPYFQWDEKKKSKKLSISANGLKCNVQDSSGFKSILGDCAFYPGNRYYFEIFIEKGSLIKIGVCRGNINYEEAFSDTVLGWGIYNGELRHNSNSSGAKYGGTFTNGDTIGVGLDTIEGTLTFYKNNVSWGLAYKDEELKKGELYAACAPMYSSDSFCLKMMIRED